MYTDEETPREIQNPPSQLALSISTHYLLPHWLAGSRTGPNGYERELRQRYRRHATRHDNSIDISLRLG